MIINHLPCGGSGGIDTSDATATVNDIALDKTAYVNGSKITGTADITKLNLFSQTTQPDIFDGIWINATANVYKLALVSDFLTQWNTKYMKSLSIAYNTFGCVVYGGKIYCIGGYTTAAVNTTYIYDIVSNTWSTGTSMPQAKSGFGCVEYGGKIYCIGGYNGAFMSVCWVYCPSGGANVIVYDSNTLIMQTLPSITNQVYQTKLLESSILTNGYTQYFTDAIINGVNADIYYGDGTQWAKIRSAV